MEAQEASEGATMNVNRPTEPFPRNLNLPTAHSLVASNYKPWCVYCEDEHYSVSCTKITAASDRRGILLKTRCSFNCLKTRHKSKDSDSTRTCRHCHQCHHQSICDHLPVSPDLEKARNVTTNTTTKVNNDNKVVLLQTVQAVAIEHSVQIYVYTKQNTTG